MKPKPIRVISRNFSIEFNKELGKVKQIITPQTVLPSGHLYDLNDLIIRVTHS